MKAASKVTKKEQPKGDNANGKEITNSETSSGETTPEIVARSRRSLTGISEGNEDEKDQQIEMMELRFMQQQRELEELKEALKESQEQRQATSLAYNEISQKLINSIPLNPGPNINKPRVPRPQDTEYQAAMQLKEKSEQEQESESSNDGKEMIKLFSHLTTAL